MGLPMVIQVDVLGHKYVFGPSQTHNESESGQKHIYAREHQLYCYFTHIRNSEPARGGGGGENTIQRKSSIFPVSKE